MHFIQPLSTIFFLPAFVHETSFPMRAFFSYHHKYEYHQPHCPNGITRIFWIDPISFPVPCNTCYAL